MPGVFNYKGGALETGKRTLIMGILNFTPDSFSDGGDFFDEEKALCRALEMQEQGADIIDIGANSTRPGAKILGEKEELGRLKRVMGALDGRLEIPISVDTFYPACAAFALENGAGVINDVSGSADPEMLKTVNEHRAGIVITHAPAGADSAAEYPNGVITAVREFFLDSMKKAYDAGLPLTSVCLDPGIGFGKTREDDAEMIRSIGWLKLSPCALLAGLSRKRITDVDGSVPALRDFSTAAANTAVISGGADIIRVHNVAAAKQAAAMADIIFRNGE